MKVVPRDGENALQDLVQIEGRKHSLAGIVQGRDIWHAPGFYLRGR
jgi:hypothetical protein